MSKNQTLYHLKELAKAGALYEYAHGDAPGGVKYKITSAIHEAVQQLTTDVEKYMKTPYERKRRKNR